MEPGGSDGVMGSVLLRILKRGVVWLGASLFSMVLFAAFFIPKANLIDCTGAAASRRGKKGKRR